MAPAARGSVGHRVGRGESAALPAAGQGTGTRGGRHRAMSPRGAGGEAAEGRRHGAGGGGGGEPSPWAQSLRVASETPCASSSARTLSR